MKNQRGQSVVEFAFVIPLFTLFLFGLIYGGTMFLQYFNLCNDARAEARRIAVMTPALRNTYFGAANESQYPTESNPKIVTNADRDAEKRTTFGTFYTVQQKIWVTTTEVEGKTTPEDVIVRVEFNRNNDDLPYVLSLFNWPPKEFAMSYRMQIEPENSEE
ncbi:MAG: pilus assembly protein [Selenomonadaceae bacterium]|nr:pilus assembly protein [Selenomonadaceae bacterium]